MGVFVVERKKLTLAALSTAALIEDVDALVRHVGDCPDGASFCTFADQLQRDAAERLDMLRERAESLRRLFELWQRDLASNHE